MPDFGNRQFEDLVSRKFGKETWMASSTIFEMGKEAGRIISRSTTIRLGEPHGAQKVRDTLQAEKAHNITAPWQLGRKPPKRKEKS